MGPGVQACRFTCKAEFDNGWAASQGYPPQQRGGCLPPARLSPIVGLGPYPAPIRATRIARGLRGPINPFIPAASIGRGLLLRLTAAAESASTSGSPPALPLSETDIYLDMDTDNRTDSSCG